MALRRVFVDSISESSASVEGERAHHLARVVRLRSGERVEVSDQQRLFHATTATCSPTQVTFDLEEHLPTPPALPPLTAAISIFKFSRFEWAVEKLTELGVDEIQPIVTDLTDSGLAAAAGKRLVRWRRIAFEAAQQSRRMAAPSISAPALFQDALAEAVPTSSVFYDVDEPKFAADRYRGALTFFTGQEGGWTDQERARAKSTGIRTAGLGPLMLRAETAAISAATICRDRQSQREPTHSED